MSNIISVRIIIYGEVQGVGYRAWTKWQANKLGLVGWVRNDDGGKVEALIQGEKEKVEEMIKRCKIGSPLAKVEDIEVIKENPVEEYKEFTIIKSAE